jgi:hypothetical protein
MVVVLVRAATSLIFRKDYNTMAVDTGASSQVQWISLMEAFVRTSCDFLEQNKVKEFPRTSELYNNQNLNTPVLDKHLAEYQYCHTQAANQLSDCSIKKIQSRLYLKKVEDAQGELPSKRFHRDVEFYIARITDLEIALKTYVEALDKNVTALRSIKANAPRDRFPGGLEGRV